MIIIDTLFPIIAMMALGYFLKRFGMTSAEFLKTLDKLVYYIFFPGMLFWKTAVSSGTDSSYLGFIAAGLLAIFAVSGLSLFYVRKTNMPDVGVGSFFQACFRFNTYIGMAIVLSVLGDEGIKLFSIFIGCVIPVLNVMAVSVLIWYSGQTLSRAQRVKYLVRALISNPLIIGCAAGMLVSETGYQMPAFINNFFALMSSMSLPLALISMGGILTFSGVSQHWQNGLAASVLKLVVLPVIGFVMLKLFGVSEIAFKTGMIYFCLPTSSSIHILSGQLDSDVELATTAVMISTLLSFLSLSVALLL